MGVRRYDRNKRLPNATSASNAVSPAISERHHLLGQSTRMGTAIAMAITAI